MAFLPNFPSVEIHPDLPEGGRSKEFSEEENTQVKVLFYLTWKIDLTLEDMINLSLQVVNINLSFRKTFERTFKIFRNLIFGGRLLGVQ